MEEMSGTRCPDSKSCEQRMDCRQRIHWMDGEPAPQTILDLPACNCTRTYQLPSCECMANGLKCTDMCKLPNCGNQSAVTTDDGSEDENDDEYEQEDEEDCRQTISLYRMYFIILFINITNQGVWSDNHNFENILKILEKMSVVTKREINPKSYHLQKAIIHFPTIGVYTFLKNHHEP